MIPKYNCRLMLQVIWDFYYICVIVLRYLLLFDSDDSNFFKTMRLYNVKLLIIILAIHNWMCFSSLILPSFQHIWWFWKVKNTKAYQIGYAHLIFCLALGIYIPIVTHGMRCLVFVWKKFVSYLNSKVLNLES